MAGLNDISQKMRPHCPHCHRSIDLSEFSMELFQRILDVIASGERVFVARFGTFTAKYVAGRTIQSFGEEKKIAGRNVIRFRAAAHAKKRVNEIFGKESTKNERRVSSRQEADQTDEAGSVDESDEGEGDPEAGSGGTSGADHPDARRAVSEAVKKAGGVRELADKIVSDIAERARAAEREPSPDGRAVKFANPTRKRRRARARDSS